MDDIMESKEGKKETGKGKMTWGDSGTLASIGKELGLSGETIKALTEVLWKISHTCSPSFLAFLTGEQVFLRNPRPSIQ